MDFNFHFFSSDFHHVGALWILIVVLLILSDCSIGILYSSFCTEVSHSKNVFPVQATFAPSVEISIEREQ